MSWFKVGTQQALHALGVGGGGLADWECFRVGSEGKWGSFLSRDGLRYGTWWNHVQQVLSLPVC